MTEKKTNIVSLFSFVWFVFFPFVVSWLMSDEYELSNEEKDFISSYRKLWWLNIIIVLLLILAYSFSFYFDVLFLVPFLNLFLVLFFIYLFINIYFIFSNKKPFAPNSFDLKLEVDKVKSWDLALVYLYLPFVNFYLLVSKKYSKDEEYYLKESNLLSFVLFLIWFLSYYFDFYALFYLLVFMIIFRAISLFLWLNFFRLKDLFYNTFPYEILLYLEALLYYIFHNLLQVIKWKRISSYKTYLHWINEFYSKSYDLDNILKKPKKYVFLFISYVIYIWYFWLILWNSLFLMNGYYLTFSVLGLLLYIIMPVVLNKKLYPLPFISLITFYILKKF